MYVCVVIGVGSRGRADHGQRGQEDGGERRAGSHPHLVAGEGLGHHATVHEHGKHEGCLRRIPRRASPLRPACENVALFPFCFCLDLDWYAVFLFPGVMVHVECGPGSACVLRSGCGASFAVSAFTVFGGVLVGLFGYVSMGRDDSTFGVAPHHARYSLVREHRRRPSLRPRRVHKKKPQVQKLVNNWLVVTSFSIGVADTVADTETIMTIGGIIDTAKRCVRDLPCPPKRLNSF